MLAVVGIAGIAAGAYFLLGSDDSSNNSSNSNDTSSPVATVQSWINAQEDGDCEAANQLMVESIQADCGSFSSSGLEVEVGAVEVVEQAETEATVAYEVLVDGEDLGSTAHLINEDGVWLIDQPFGGEMTGGAGQPSNPSPAVDVTVPGGDAAPPLPAPDYSDAPLVQTPDVNGCYNGLMEVCDTLWGQTPDSSDIQEWAGTCGGRLPPSEYDTYNQRCDELL